MKIPNRHGAILSGFREKEQTKVRWGMMMTYSAYTWLEFWKIMEKLAAGQIPVCPAAILCFRNLTFSCI